MFSANIADEMIVIFVPGPLFEPQAGEIVGSMATFPARAGMEDGSFLSILLSIMLMEMAVICFGYLLI